MRKLTGKQAKDILIKLVNDDEMYADGISSEVEEELIEKYGFTSKQSGVLQSKLMGMIRYAMGRDGK